MSEDSPSDSDGGSRPTLRGPEPRPHRSAVFPASSQPNHEGTTLLILCPVPCVQVISASRNALLLILPNSCLLFRHLAQASPPPGSLPPLPLIQATGSTAAFGNSSFCVMTVRTSRGQISQVLHIPLCQCPAQEWAHHRQLKNIERMDETSGQCLLGAVCVPRAVLRALPGLPHSIFSAVQ